MEQEFIEIIEALNGATMLPGSFDKMFTKHLNRMRTESKPLTDVSRRHTLRLMHKYRKQIPTIFNKHEELWKSL